MQNTAHNVYWLTSNGWIRKKKSMIFIFLISSFIRLCIFLFFAQSLAGRKQKSRRIFDRDRAEKKEKESAAQDKHAFNWPIEIELLRQQLNERMWCCQISQSYHIFNLKFHKLKLAHTYTNTLSAATAITTQLMVVVECVLFQQTIATYIGYAMAIL